jgi:hypothetical protein
MIDKLLENSPRSNGGWFRSKQGEAKTIATDVKIRYASKQGQSRTEEYIFDRRILDSVGRRNEMNRALLHNSRWHN